jgi:hypothetical protein
MLTSVYVAPFVRLAKERRAAFDLAGKHLAGHYPISGYELNLTVNAEVVLLVIPLEQPAEVILNDSADDANAAIALFG